MLSRLIRSLDAKAAPMLKVWDEHGRTLFYMSCIAIPVAHWDDSKDMKRHAKDPQFILQKRRELMMQQPVCQWWSRKFRNKWKVARIALWTRKRINEDRAKKEKGTGRTSKR
ncbi:MAG: hypothetical protein Q9159_001583 [Coniocarpon cinnabarinum]